MTDATNVPPGWYPDANAPGGQRWWDGTQWTEHTQGAAAYQPFAPLKAPEGTKTNTVWIWLVALVPLLGIASIFMIDFSGYMESVMQNPGSSSGMFELLLSPGYLVATLLGWGSTILTVIFGFLDWRALKARGIPQPFHWAFGFLILVGAGLVYPIGRCIVARRRAGGTLAPMWVAIAVYAVLIIASIVWTVLIFNQMMASMPSYLYS